MFSIVSYIEPDEETTVLYGIHGYFNSKQEANNFLNKIKKIFNKNNSDGIIDVYKFKDCLTVVMQYKTEFTDEECVAIHFEIKEINTPESAMDINPKTIDSIMEKLKIW